MKKQSVQYLLLGVVFFFYYAAYTSYFSFISMFLSTHNFTKSNIGTIFMIISLVNIVAQPTIGYLASRVFSINKVLISLLITSSIIAFTLTPALKSTFLTTISVVAVGLCDYSIVSLLDSVATIKIDKYPSINYSLVRAMGSISSAVTALFVGEILSKIGNEKILYFHAFFLVITLIVTMILSKDDKENKQEKFVEKEKTNVFTKKFILFLFAAFLANIGWRAILTYLPVVLVDLGGTSAHQGRAMFLMTIGIAPIMFIYPKLRDKLGTNKMLILGFILMTIRVFSMTLISSVNTAIYLQLLEALSYGIFTPATIEYISKIIPKNNRAQALSIFHVVITAFTGVVGNLIAGMLYDSYGYRYMYLIYSIFSFVAILIIVFSIKKD